MNSRVYPVPESMSGGWDIEQGQGAVDLDRRKMYVPLGESSRDMYTRTHEIAHIKWSPSKEIILEIKDVSSRAIEVCEDARVNLMAHKTGCDMSASHEFVTKETFERLGPRERLEVMILLGHDKYTLVPWWSGWTTWREREKCDQVYAILDKAVKDTSFRDTVRAARLIDFMYSKEIEDMKESMGEDVAERVMKSKAYEEERGSKIDARDAKTEELSETEPTETSYKPGWGPMELSEPPRTRVLKRKMRSRKRAIDTGAVFAYPERLLSDSSVFSRSKRWDYASVLIDNSGSMSLDDRSLKRY